MTLILKMYYIYIYNLQNVVFLTSILILLFSNRKPDFFLTKTFFEKNIRIAILDEITALHCICFTLYLAINHPSSITCSSSCSSSSMQVPEGHVVMLSFRLFDLEADPTCRYDYLDVYNGHTRLVQKLGRFCGTFRPGALISTSNTMMLEMVSDEGTGGRGFLAAFSAGKPHMEGATAMSSRKTRVIFGKVSLCLRTVVHTGFFAQRSSSVEGG